MRQKRYQEKFKKTPIDKEYLERFMESFELSVSDVAMYLGCTRNTINNYLAGKTKIPHAVKLACDYYFITDRGLDH